MLQRVAVVVVAFLLTFSLVGLNNYEPRRPVLRFSSCMLGVNPVLAFGSSRVFNAGWRNRGTPDITVANVFVSWPGGTFAVWLTPDCGFQPNPIAVQKKP